MNNLKNLGLALIFTALISACGGGGGGGSDAPPANAAPVETNFFAQGIYFGPATDLDGYTSPMVAIVGADGTFEAIDTSDGSVSYGVLSSSGSNSAAGDIRGLAAPGYYFPVNGQEYIDASISFSQSAEDGTLTGSTSYQGVTQSSFILFSMGADYDNPPSSFSAVAGTYAAYINYVDVYIAIDSQGNLTGYDDTGCQYSSKLTQAVAGKNIYSLTVNVSGCGAENGNYPGKAYFSLTDTDLYFALVAHNTTNGTGGYFRWVFP